MLELIENLNRVTRTYTITSIPAYSNKSYWYYKNTIKFFFNELTLCQPFPLTPRSRLSRQKTQIARSVLLSPIDTTRWKEVRTTKIVTITPYKRNNTIQNVSFQSRSIESYPFSTYKAQMSKVFGTNRFCINLSSS